jgi:beta-glucosidase
MSACGGPASVGGPRPPVYLAGRMVIRRRQFLGWSAAAAAATTLPMQRARGAKPVARPTEFPKGFVWGAAAASYQIEGAATADGKGPSIWDMFTRKPGAIWKDQNGDVSCDHYHRYKEDVAIMKSLGIQAYRLSISWPRVLPDGTGGQNAKGLDFYDRLIDEILAAGITPWVTLYHWDLPLALYHRGGWLNRDVGGWFADYTALMAKRLGDRVKHWMPLNEPQVFLGAGLIQGRHAPGDKLRFAEFLLACHNTLLAHGRSVQALRATPKLPARIGTAQAGYNYVPATDSAADLAAAKARYLATADDSYKQNAYWLDAMILGRYPDDAVKLYGAAMPAIRAGDMETIKQKLDFLGMTLYSADPVRRGKDGKPEVIPWPFGYPITGFEWAVAPSILRLIPTWLHERYKLPIVIAENGLSVRDWVTADGAVHDPDRIDFTARYLRQLAAAIAAGVPVEAYFHWSILDNFEWAEGYKHRFGLVYVNYETQKRTIKDSGKWYREVIASNGRNVLATTAPDPRMY